MLPIYEAISFQGIIEKGAHTKPWIVAVKTNDSVHPYIVKLYTTEQIKNRNSVTGEVISNQLAAHFLLKAPQAALINFNEDFISKLTNIERSILVNKDTRIKFGTLQIESDFSFIEGLPKKTFSNNCSAGLDTFFAFDNLIRNADRGSYKPNILFSNSDTWLIDHEFAFDNIKNAYKGLNEYQEWEEKIFKYHIALPYLKKATKKTKSEYFTDFMFMLNELRINSLEGFYTQLEQQGYVTNKIVINNYLAHINKNFSNFEGLLKYLVN